MALSESLKGQALRELDETKCQGCGGQKGQKRSFCPRCYHSLPMPMRQKLYRSFGDGYAEAYDEAKDWLKQGGR